MDEQQSKISLYQARRSSFERRRVFGLYRTAQEARLGNAMRRHSIDGACAIGKSARGSGVYAQLFRCAYYRRAFRRARSLYFEWTSFVSWRRGILATTVAGVVCTGILSYVFSGSRVMAEDVSPLVMVRQKVLGAETESVGSVSDRSAFEGEIREMVKGYPIEDMAPYIAKQDRRVAAYLVAIAKKESNWGRRIPVYYGENCFNYWGYRGQDEIMGSAGHTCFDTPKEAVVTVAKRLNRLVLEENLTSANDLLVWKCGSSCAGHDSYDVSKWVSDVDAYYKAVFAMGK